MYRVQIFKEGTCDFDDQASLGNSEALQAYLILLGFALVRFIDVAFFLHIEGKALCQQKDYDSLFWDSLYCCGLEPNLLHLRRMAVVYMQGIGKDCIGVEDSGCFKEPGNYTGAIKQ